METLQVLMVDDDEGDIFMIEDVLLDLQLGLDLKSVQNGYQALAYLRKEPPYESAATPDLLLLDLNMPLMSGRQVLHEIRADQELCHLPVIIFSTSSAVFDIQSAYAEGSNCYITKPVGIKELETLLKSLSSFWGQVAELPDCSAPGC